MPATGFCVTGQVIRTNFVGASLRTNNRAVALHTELYCSEFEMMDRVDVPIVSFTNVSLRELVLAEKFDVMALPPHDVDDGVRMLATEQGASGFIIIGWCRAPKETDNSISDAKVMHVVSCLPGGGKFSDIAKEKLFKLPAPLDTDDFENENNDLPYTTGFSGAATAKRFEKPAPSAKDANENEYNNPPAQLVPPKISKTDWMPLGSQSVFDCLSKLSERCCIDIYFLVSF